MLLLGECNNNSPIVAANKEADATMTLNIENRLCLCAGEATMFALKIEDG
jgi:hypothetical protein